jgi:hypothetical protein
METTRHAAALMERRSERVLLLLSLLCQEMYVLMA